MEVQSTTTRVRCGPLQALLLELEGVQLELEWKSSQLSFVVGIRSWAVGTGMEVQSTAVGDGNLVVHYKFCCWNWKWFSWNWNGSPVN